MRRGAVTSLILALTVAAVFVISNALSYLIVGKPAGWNLIVPFFGLVAAIEIHLMLRRKPFRTPASARLRRDDAARAARRFRDDDLAARRPTGPRRTRPRSRGEGKPPLMVRVVFTLCVLAFLTAFFGPWGALGVAGLWMGGLWLIARFRVRRRPVKPRLISRSLE